MYIPVVYSICLCISQLSILKILCLLFCIFTWTMGSMKNFSLKSKLKPQQEESSMEKSEKDHNAALSCLQER